MPKTTDVSDVSIKKIFLKRIGLDKKDGALVAIDLRQNDELQEWVLQYMTGVSELGLPVVILGAAGTTITGDVMLISDPAQYDEVIAASDLLVALNPNEKLLKDAWSHGCVPICEAGEFVEDYNPIKETGNAFIAPMGNVWGYFAATVRALETYRFPYDWRHLQSSCRKSAE